MYRASRSVCCTLTAYCILHTRTACSVCCTLTAYCILHTAYCILHTAYSHTAYCILHAQYAALILHTRTTCPLLLLRILHAHYSC
jgi:hypothetical protein